MRTGSIQLNWHNRNSDLSVHGLDRKFLHFPIFAINEDDVNLVLGFGECFLKLFERPSSGFAEPEDHVTRPQIGGFRWTIEYVDDSQPGFAGRSRGIVGNRRSGRGHLWNVNRLRVAFIEREVEGTASIT